MALRPRSRAALGALLVLLASVLVRWWLLPDPAPVFSPDSPSYVSYAREWRTSGQLPRITQRPPGYPLLLLATAGSDERFDRTVRVQQILGVASVLLLYVLVWFLTRSVAAAITAALISVFLVDLLLMERVVYAETAAGLLTNAGALLLVTAVNAGRPRRGPHVRPWLLAASGFCWSAVAFMRPVFLAAVAVFVALMIVLWLWRSLSWRATVAALLVPIAGSIGWAAFNAARGDGFRFTTGVGYSLLNYLAYPEMHRHLPAEMGEVQTIYLTTTPTPVGHLWWWMTLPAIVASERAHGNVRHDDDIARDVALQAIRSRPMTYLSIWSDALGRQLFSYDLLHGLLVNNQAPAAGNLAVSDSTYGIAQFLERVWKVGIVPLSAAALLLPVAAVAARWRGLAMPKGCLALWCIVVAVVLAGVTVEPFSRQARYRIPIQHVMIALAAMTVVGAARRLPGEAGGGHSETSKRVST